MNPLIVLILIVDIIAVVLALGVGFIVNGDPLDIEKNKYIWAGAFLFSMMMQTVLVLLYRKR